MYVNIKETHISKVFTWDYQYYDTNGKRRKISCVDINNLEQKVKDRGLKWKKL